MNRPLYRVHWLLYRIVVLISWWTILKPQLVFMPVLCCELPTLLCSLLNGVISRNASPMEVFEYLHSLQWLTDMYMIDYYTERNWCKVPESWIGLIDLSTREWANVLDVSRPLTELKLPPSFASLRDYIRDNAVCRSAPKNPHDLSLLMDITADAASSFGSLTKMNALRVRIKEKKRHEIDRILELVHMISSRGDVETVIDVGAGLGHLSRLLAIRFPELQIKTIEGDAELVSMSSALDSGLIKRMRTNFAVPDREHRYIHPDCDAEETLSGSIGSKSLLIGLHPCGDLSATTLRAFVKYTDVSNLVLFGCCYHKLNGGLDKLYRQSWSKELEVEQQSDLGFPLSNKYAKCNLSYAARELACHAQEQFIQELKSGKVTSEYNHAYRALLELVIVRCGGGRHLSVKGVKCAHQLSFLEYTRLALADRQELLGKVLSMAESDAEVRSSIDGIDLVARRVFVLYCLRVLVAPLIETLIVRDRQQYLEENGCAVTVLPLFDPIMSPRNIVIVASK